MNRRVSRSPLQLADLGLGCDRRRAFRVSVFGLCAELAIALTTAIPNGPIVPFGLVIPLFIGIFAVHIRTVAVLSSRADGRLSWSLLRDLVSPVPVVVRIGFVAFLWAAWSISGAAIGHLGGQPEQLDGRFFLNDHGSLIAVTHRAYLHAQLLQLRTFTLIPSVFYALGVIVNWPGQTDETPKPALSGFPSEPA